MFKLWVCNSCSNKCLYRSFAPEIKKKKHLWKLWKYPVSAVNGVVIGRFPVTLEVYAETPLLSGGRPLSMVVCLHPTWVCPNTWKKCLLLSFTRGVLEYGR